MAPVLALGLLFLLFGGKRKRISVSTVEDSKESADNVASKEQNQTYEDEPYASVIGDAIGAPYWYGKGSPSTPWADIWDGVDCSGSCLMAQVRIGIIPSTFPDMGASDIANACDPIPVGQQIPGDFAIYPGHVMLVYSYPRESEGGHSSVWGARGGDRNTHGDNPNAYVGVYSSATYNPSFITYGRWKKSA
jgi:cell wall-associated NlpC family hydrolase